MSTQWDQYDIRYLIQQYQKMKIIYEDDSAMGKEKMVIMKKAFKSYDKDGNGVLDRHEIVDLLSNHFKEQGIKKKPTKADVEDFFGSLDEDHSGEIDFDEFKHFLIENMKRKLLEPLEEYLKAKGLIF